MHKKICKILEKLIQRRKLIITIKIVWFKLSLASQLLVKRLLNHRATRRSSHSLKKVDVLEHLIAHRVECAKRGSPAGQLL